MYQDSETGEEGDTLFVWGTNLTINGITKRVRAFYKGFRANDDDAMPKYEEMLLRVADFLEPQLTQIPPDPFSGIGNLNVMPDAPSTRTL